MSAGHHESGMVQRPAGAGLVRVAAGLVLAVIAVALTFYNPDFFAAATALIAFLAAREWHRLVRAPALRAARHGLTVHIIVTTASVAAALAAMLLRQAPASFALLAAGAAASFLVARREGDNAAWHAIGVLYVGIPCVALVALQALARHGSTLVMGTFLIVWATDTGALVFGRLIGGAKLAPAISPGKTWAGTIGGSLTGAAVYGLYIAVLGFNVAAGFAFGLVFSIVAHAGDLLESKIKRHFGTKDTGGLIPGHGGMLDRIDSMLAAAPAMALLVFGLPLLGIPFNPLFGGLP